MARTLRGDPEAVVVDLGYGASPVTTVELAERLRSAAGGPVRVVGIEIDPARVRAAGSWQRPGVEFRHGGFEVPLDRQPAAIRAANVLRQYDEAAVPDAWASMAARLAPGGLLVEGTCDELGRLAAWVAVPPSVAVRPGASAPAVQPETLTVSLDLRQLERPSQVAERLPKALIHRNVPGERVHALLAALDDAWARSSAQAVFGPRQRWIATVGLLRAQGWEVRDGATRWRLGELTVPWSAVAPVSGPLAAG